MARLMRPGARGGWVNGSLSWSGLDSWQVQSGEYRPDHLALVRELHAIHRAREGQVAYYSYGAEKTLDLSDCDSAQLWSLLDEAARLGLKLIHAHPELGEVRCHSGASCSSTSREGDRASLVQRGCLRVDGEDADGSSRCCSSARSGHGVVCAEPATAARDPRHERPAAAARAPRAGRRRRRCSGCCSTASGSRSRQAELERFAEELCPGAAQHRHGRLRPTARSRRRRSPRPRSCCARATAPATLSRLRWEWAYRVGDAARRAPLAEQRGRRPGFATSTPSARCLAAADLTGTGLERFGLLDGAGGPAARTRPVSLTGLDSMRLTTEVLPRLARAGRSRGRGRGRARRLPRRRRLADDRRLDRRDRGRARLVRPRRDDQRRGPRAAVRRGVRGARARRVAACCSTTAPTSRC